MKRPKAVVVKWGDSWCVCDPYEPIAIFKSKKLAKKYKKQYNSDRKVL